jgi:hypothetical protein
MALLPLGIRAGTTPRIGLRQAFNFPTVPFSTVVTGSPALVFFFSTSGQEIGSLFGGRDAAEKLNFSVVVEKNGGIKEAAITFVKKNEIPLFNGMKALIYWKSSKLGTVFIRNIPDTDTASETITITGVGLYQRLREKTIDKEYNSQTILQILTDLQTDIEGQDITYDSLLVVPPSITITKIKFEDETIASAIERLLAVANFDLSTTEYVTGVDHDEKFYFIALESDAQTQYFEGFDYQSPQVDIETTKIINAVRAYRTTDADSKATEFVALYQDTDSIDENGEQERKTTVPSFTNDATIGQIANGILDNRKDPKKRIALNNLTSEARLDNGFYKISNKRQLQRVVVSEFTDLSEWTISTPTSTVSVTQNNVFSGRRCFLWTVASFDANFITQSFDRIYGPQKLVLYIRQDTVGAALTARVTGDSVATKKTINQENNTGIHQEDERSLIQVEELTHTTSKEELFTGIIVNEWKKFEIDLTDFIYVDSVFFSIPGTIDIYLDRLEIYANQYFQNNLRLEATTYKTTDTALLVDAQFGEMGPSIVDKIQNIDKKNSIPLDIFSKQ